MRTVPVTFRMDAELRKAMDRTLEEIGIPFSAAISAFSRVVVRTGRIPFELMTDDAAEFDQDELLRRAESINNGTAVLIDMTKEFEDD